MLTKSFRSAPRQSMSIVKVSREIIVNYTKQIHPGSDLNAIVEIQAPLSITTSEDDSAWAALPTAKTGFG